MRLGVRGAGGTLELDIKYTPNTQSMQGPQTQKHTHMMALGHICSHRETHTHSISCAQRLIPTCVHSQPLRHRRHIHRPLQRMHTHPTSNSYMQTQTHVGLSCLHTPKATSHTRKDTHKPGMNPHPIQRVVTHTHSQGRGYLVDVCTHIHIPRLMDMRIHYVAPR